MASGPITSWQIDGETVADYFFGLQNHCRWWLQPWNQKMLTPWRKSYDQPRQHIKKQRHFFATKVRLVKAMIFPVVHVCVWMWELDHKEVEHWRIDAFELWCWRRLSRVPSTARRSNQSILKEISPEYSLEGLKLKLQYFGHLMQRTDSFEKTLCWERLKAAGERDDRVWDGWKASPTQWTWVWVNSGSWWWTGRPWVLQSMGSQRLGHDWATELLWRTVKKRNAPYLKEWKCSLGHPYRKLCAAHATRSCGHGLSWTLQLLYLGLVHGDPVWVLLSKGKTREVPTELV